MGKSRFREPRTASVDIAIWWHNLLPCACSQMSFSISPQSMMVGMQKPFTVRSLKNSEMPAQGPRLPQFTKTKCRLWVLVGLELIVSFLIWLSVEKKRKSVSGFCFPTSNTRRTLRVTTIVSDKVQRKPCLI